MPLSDTLTERLVRLPGAPENTDRPRIVIDTNVLLDLLFWHDASAERGLFSYRLPGGPAELIDPVGIAPRF